MTDFVVTTKAHYRAMADVIALAADLQYRCYITADTPLLARLRAAIDAETAERDVFAMGIDAIAPGDIIRFAEPPPARKKVKRAPRK